jgi:hypothetical protein
MIGRFAAARSVAWASHSWLSSRKFEAHGRVLAFAHILETATVQGSRRGRQDATGAKKSVDSHIFIACNHGESLEPMRQQWMLTLVQTARMP